MAIKVKKGGVYADPVGIFAKKAGVYSAVAGVSAKVGGVYVNVGTSLASQVAALFAAGEKGGAILPGDFAKAMWQDVARTQPVTAVGQTVASAQLQFSALPVFYTQATAGRRPVLAQDANGRFYLDCTGGKWLGAPAIDLTGTDKVTFALAARTLALPPSSGGTCFTFSPSAFSNPGAFALEATTIADGTPYVSTYLMGTTATGVNTIPTLPLMMLYSCQFDIAGTTRATEMIPKLGDVSAATFNVGATSAGTGNFGSYPSFIGSNGTASYASNHFYGMILRGVASSAAEMEIVKDFLRDVTAQWAVTAIGDSIVAAYAGGSALTTLIPNIWPLVVARPGDNIANQKAQWQALSAGIKKAQDAAFIQVGINDMNPTSAASVTLAALQDLVNTVRADVSASCKILISQMTPARSYWVEAGGSDAYGESCYQKWLAMNDAIAGNGPNAITGLDGRVTAHIALLNDGAGNLDPAYSVGDKLHTNNAGRQINADAIKAQLIALGMPQ